MKRLVVAAVAMATLSGAAFGADIPARPAAAVAIPAPAYNWTGFYIGGQVGYSWLRDSQYLTSPSFELSVSNQMITYLGGGHIGFNYQLNQIVFGVEADFEAGSAGTWAVPDPFSNTTGTVRLDWQGSVRGRLGIAADRALYYVTAGGAWAEVTNSYSTPGTQFQESDRSTRSGWTAGGGVEYAFAPNWTGRAEYRFAEFEKHRNNLDIFLSPPGFSVDRVTQHAVRLGASYKF